MAKTFYLKIEGERHGAFPGDSNREAWQDWLECFALEHTLESLPDSPTPHHTPLTVSLHFGAATPLILDACSTGERLAVQIALLHYGREGTEEVRYRIQLEGARIARVREWIPTIFLDENKPYEPMLDVSFAYEQLIWADVVNQTETRVALSGQTLPDDER